MASSAACRGVILVLTLFLCAAISTSSAPGNTDTLAEAFERLEHGLSRVILDEETHHPLQADDVCEEHDMQCKNLLWGDLMPDEDSSTVIVGTLDGMVYALSAETGKMLWSFKSGGGLLSSSTTPPIITGKPEAADSLSVIPGLDGSIFLYYHGQPLQRFPLSSHELVDNTFSISNDGHILLGSKQMKLFSLDPNSGRPNYYRSTHQPEASGTTSMEGLEEALPSKQQLLLGRTEYTISAVDEVSGHEQWNLTIAEYTVTLRPGMASAGLAGSLATPEVFVDDGKLCMWDNKQHRCSWEHIFDSIPVVLYTLHPESGLLQQLGPSTHPYAVPPEQRTPHMPPPMRHHLLPSNTDTEENLPSWVYVGEIGGQHYAVSCPSYDTTLYDKQLTEPVVSHWGVESKGYLPMPHSEGGGVLGLHLMRARLLPMQEAPFVDRLPGPQPERQPLETDSSDLLIMFMEIQEELEREWLATTVVCCMLVGTAISALCYCLPDICRSTTSNSMRHASKAHLTHSNAMITEVGAPSGGDSAPLLESESSLLPSATNVSRYSSEFEQLSRLGKGGFGTVFRVRNHLDGKEYAVKRVVLRGTEKARKKAMREVTLLARLDHPNVVRYYQAWLEDFDESLQMDRMSMVSGEEGDYTTMTEEPSTTSHTDSKWGATEDCAPYLARFYSDMTEDGDAAAPAAEPSEPSTLCSPQPTAELPVCLYIQMQLAETTLKEKLQDPQRSMDWAINMDIFRQILQGLEHIHEQGLIHRDLTPANIFIAKDNTVKIGDFGLSRETVNRMSHSPSYTHMPFSLRQMNRSHTQGVGTSLYMSPEQLAGRPYSNKVDLYSVGIVFFELFYQTSTQMERVQVLTRLRNNCVLPADMVLRHDKQRDFILWLTARDPAERPSVADVLAHEVLGECRSPNLSPSNGPYFPSGALDDEELGLLWVEVEASNQYALIEIVRAQLEELGQKVTHFKGDSFEHASGNRAQLEFRFKHLQLEKADHDRHQLVEELKGAVLAMPLVLNAHCEWSNLLPLIEPASNT